MDAAALKQSKTVRGSKTRPKKYQLRREEALDAAAAVFADLGYYGASTSMIAERIGIRQGSLYYYFTSKEAALEEVCAKGVADFIEGLEEICAAAGPVEDRVRAAITNHLKPIIDRPDYVKTFIRQRQFLPDTSRKRIGRQVRRYERLLGGLFRSGVDIGTFASDLNCELTALRMITECNGVFSWYGRRAHGLSIQEIAAEIAARFLAGVRARDSQETENETPWKR